MFHQNLIGFTAYRQDRQENSPNQTENHRQTPRTATGLAPFNKSSQSAKPLYVAPQLGPEALTSEPTHNESLKGKESHSLGIRQSEKPEASPFLDLVASVLRDGFMAEDPRSFDAIFRQGDNSGQWRNEKNRVHDPVSAAKAVLDSGQIIGLRHRYHTRMVAIDLDNHATIHWTEDDPRLRRLIVAAEASDCWPVLVPSPHGFHLWLILPAALPIVTAHHCLRALLCRAGIGDRKIELFPSLSTGDDVEDAKERPRSNGIRLPGQFGTITPGDPSSDPELIWRDLRHGLDHTEPGEGWADLCRIAAANKRNEKRQRTRRPTPWRPCQRRSFASATKRLASVIWRGPGESNRHLGTLANIGASLGIRDKELLAAFIEEHARNAPGFDQHASADTKQRLSAWSREWAQCNIDHPPEAQARPSRSKDPGRNQRLHAEAVRRLFDAAQRAAKTFGEDAAKWSARRIAQWSGLNRGTLAKLMGVGLARWRTRVLTAVFSRFRSGGIHPYSKGGGAHGLVTPPQPSTSLTNHQINPLCKFGRKNLFSSCLASNAPPPDPNPCRPPAPVDQATLPTKPTRENSSPIETAKRQREREELARWLQQKPQSNTLQPPPVGGSVQIDRGCAGWSACRVLAADALRWVFQSLTDGRIFNATPHPNIWRPCP